MRKMGRPFRFALLSALLLLPTLGAPRAHAAESIRVAIDQATLIRLPEKVGTIIVGNPLIADVAVEANGTVVVTGKGYGATNIIALDRQGNVLMERAIDVQGPRDQTVVVFRGIDRETYSCQPTCERRITLGDQPQYFGATLSQTSNRNVQAQGGATQRGR
jgi:hypothetical protein